MTDYLVTTEVSSQCLVHAEHEILIFLYFEESSPTRLTALQSGPVYEHIFENKVALVTGAASGLGLATAKAFAESGAAVVLADWNEKSARSAAEEMAVRGHKAIAIHCDVADDAQVEAMVEETVASFGHLDAAYNNAGVQNLLRSRQTRGPVSYEPAGL